MKKISLLVKMLKMKGVYPPFRIVEDTGVDPIAKIEGKKYIMFASNNYLGLSTHPKVREAVSKVAKKYGAGPGGSRLLCGNLDIVNEFEAKMAKFIGVEDVITYPTGYMANNSVFRATMDPFIGKLPYTKGSGVIFSDKLNHASIVDGCRLSESKKEIYEHLDMEDLEKKLALYPKRTHKLIVSDGVFSMDGDIAPLPEINALAKKYKASVMIDDAHSLGVLGKKGGGTTQHFGLTGKDIDINMGTLDKALGATGGYIGGSKDLIDYYKVSTRSFVFSSTIPACLIAGAMKVLDLIEEDKSILERTRNNALYVRKELRKAGFTILGTADIPVIPLLIGEERKATKFAAKVFENGVFAPCTQWPAVEKGKARLRMITMGSHTQEHLDRLLEVLTKAGKEFKVI